MTCSVTPPQTFRALLTMLPAFSMKISDFFEISKNFDKSHKTLRFLAPLFNTRTLRVRAIKSPCKTALVDALLAFFAWAALPLLKVVKIRAALLRLDGVGEARGVLLEGKGRVQFEEIEVRGVRVCGIEAAINAGKVTLTVQKVDGECDLSWTDFLRLSDAIACRILLYGVIEGMGEFEDKDRQIEGKDEGESQGIIEINIGAINVGFGNIKVRCESIACKINKKKQTVRAIIPNLIIFADNVSLLHLTEFEYISSQEDTSIRINSFSSTFNSDLWALIKKGELIGEIFEKSDWRQFEPGLKKLRELGDHNNISYIALAIEVNEKEKRKKELFPKKTFLSEDRLEIVLSSISIAISLDDEDFRGLYKESIRVNSIRQLLTLAKFTVSKNRSITLLELTALSLTCPSPPTQILSLPFISLRSSSWGSYTFSLPSECEFSASLSTISSLIQISQLLSKPAKKSKRRQWGAVTSAPVTWTLAGYAKGARVEIYQIAQITLSDVNAGDGMVRVNTIEASVSGDKVVDVQDIKMWYGLEEVRRYMDLKTGMVYPDMCRHSFLQALNKVSTYLTVSLISIKLPVSPDKLKPLLNLPSFPTLANQEVDSKEDKEIPIWKTQFKIEIVRFKFSISLSTLNQHILKRRRLLESANFKKLIEVFEENSIIKIIRENNLSEEIFAVSCSGSLLARLYNDHSSKIIASNVDVQLMDYQAQIAKVGLAEIRLPSSGDMIIEVKGMEVGYGLNLTFGINHIQKYIANLTKIIPQTSDKPTSTGVVAQTSKPLILRVKLISPVIKVYTSTSPYSCSSIVLSTSLISFDRTPPSNNVMICPLSMILSDCGNALLTLPTFNVRVREEWDNEHVHLDVQVAAVEDASVWYQARTVAELMRMPQLRQEYLTLVGINPHKYGSH